MPFDENGIYHEDEYRSPQTGGLAGVNILNQVQSYGNYRRARESELLKQMLALHASGQAGSDISNTEGGANAMGVLGIDPANVQSDFAKSGPEVFKRSAQDLDPEKTTPEALWKLGATTGAVRPDQSITEGVSLFGKKIQDKAATARQDAVAVAEEKAILTSLEKAKAGNMRRTTDEHQAAELSAQQVVAGARLTGREYTPLQLQAIQDWVQAHEGLKVGGLEEAKTTELTERGNKEKAVAHAINMKLSHQIAHMDAQTAATNVMANLNGMKAVYQDAKTKGTLPPPDTTTANLRELGAEKREALKSLARTHDPDGRNVLTSAIKAIDNHVAELETDAKAKKTPTPAAAKGPYPPNHNIKLKDGTTFVSDANGNRPGV